MASYQPRKDIEKILAQMGTMPRSAQTQNYQPVTQAAIIPTTRGLVKVQARPIQLTSTSGVAQSVTPTIFRSEDPGGDVVITRWFEHK